jgi:DNA-binding transcriptional regulator LsrR (DeoR family)
MDSLGLRAAVVVPGASKSASAREILLAQGALELLKECLPTLPQVRYIGLGWGRAVLAFVEALEWTDMFLSGTAEVVPLIGGSGQSLKIFQFNEIARRVAAALRVSARLLPAPALVKNESLRAVLFAEVSVRPVAEAWRKLDVAVVGIGRKLDPTYLNEYLQEVILQHEPLEPSSVSDVCSHYFAAGGEALEEEHDARLIAASRDECRWIPLAVGMAVPRRSPG